MEGVVIWRGSLYGGGRYMEGVVIWRELLYGGGCYMEGVVIWRGSIKFTVNLCFVLLCINLLIYNCLFVYKFTES